MTDTPISIGSDRQLLLDRRLIDELQDARQVLHQPMRRNAAVRIDHPWEEGGLAYAVLFKDGDRFRAWYRCIPHADNNKTDRACTAYVESSDGITWHKPELGLIDFQGSTANNLVIDDPDLVNFSRSSIQKPQSKSATKASVGAVPFTRRPRPTASTGAKTPNPCRPKARSTRTTSPSATRGPASTSCTPEAFAATAN